MTAIIISHKLNEIKAIADKVTIIRDGKTIETLDMHGDDVSEDRIIRGMVGRDLSSRYPERENPVIGEELLRIEDWTVHHPLDGSREIIHQANLNVRAGEVRRIAGLMGAGRTELAMSVFGHSYGTASRHRSTSAASRSRRTHRDAGDRQRHRLRHRGPPSATAST